MNWLHRRLCSSTYWKTLMREDVLPWVLDGLEADLGGRVLEVGPGPGAATDLLQSHARHLTCVEIDRALAHELAARSAGGSVTVICGDATRLPLGGRTFDAAVSLTMLHHVPSMAQQDALFAEVARVLRPAGVFAGFDGIAGPLFRLLHLFDRVVPVDPATLPARLARAGFENVTVDVKSHGFAFRARRRD